MYPETVELIQKRLHAAFHPCVVRVRDDSYAHRKHASAPSGQGHFKVRIASKTLLALPRIKAHRAIHEILADLMHTQIHALSIVLMPLEDAP